MTGFSLRPHLVCFTLASFFGSSGYFSIAGLAWFLTTVTHLLLDQHSESPRDAFESAQRLSGSATIHKAGRAANHGRPGEIFWVVGTVNCVIARGHVLWCKDCNTWQSKLFTLGLYWIAGYCSACTAMSAEWT